MSGRFFLSGTIPLYEGAAQPLSTFTFYVTGTTTPQDTYSDAGLTSANANPVVTDANGYLGEVFLSRQRYKVVWKNASGTTLKTWDPVDKDKIHTRGAGLPSDPHPGQIHDNTTDGIRYERKIDSAAWLTIGTTDSVGNSASVTEVLTGTDDTKFPTADSLAALWQRGANITPSGGTVSLPSTGGGVFNVAAGDFSSISTAQGGRKVVFIMGGVSVITHDGTSLILPGAKSHTTEAGDIYEFTNEAAADGSGTNWRCTGYSPASGVPIKPSSAISAKTGNYTATIADRGKSLTFSGLSADATLTLPAAATVGDGFLLYVANADTSASNYGVTVDGNASETVDGFTTRKMHRGARIALLCDGSNWRTVSGRWRYVSPAITLTAATPGTVTHGLGVRPETVSAYLICTTGEFGYTAGDYLSVSNAGDQNTASVYGLAIAATSTSVITYSVGTTNIFRTVNLSTGASVVLTLANWTLVIVAEA